MIEANHYHVLAADGHGWSVIHLTSGDIMLDLGAVCFICNQADFIVPTGMITAGLSPYTVGDIIAYAGPGRAFCACEYKILVLLFDQTVVRLLADELPILAHMCSKAVATLGPGSAKQSCQAALPASIRALN